MLHFGAVDRERLRQLLDAVRAGKTSPSDAYEALVDLPFAEQGYARVDLHRSVRMGLPEVILGHGKTPEQVVGIAGALLERGQRVLVTRASLECAEAMQVCHSEAVWHAQARCLVVEPGGVAPAEAAAKPGAGQVLVITAGTADIPVAEEARVCAEALGNQVDHLYDVGVAGIHRLLEARDRLKNARVLIVVAGMEGALASVVGGLVPRPVIAVPTSVGYGASFGGLAALLGMLNSCSSGVSVVNIDNGFGAAYAATLINRQGEI